MKSVPASLLDDRERDVFENILIAFGREPGFLEKGPGVLLYQSPSMVVLRSFPFGESSSELAFHQKAATAFDEFSAGRTTFTWSKSRSEWFAAARCKTVAGRTALVMVYGWPRVEAQTFLVGFAAQMDLLVPREARLTNEERNGLAPALRSFLFK